MIALPGLRSFTLPSFTLPAGVASVVSRLPASPPAWMLCAALTLGIGRIVSREAVAALAGRRFALIVRELGLAVHFEGTADGFRPAREPHRPELTVTASLRDYIALALREEDPDTLFFARRLAIEGDTELGLTVKNLLDQIDWDSLPARLPLLGPITWPQFGSDRPTRHRNLP